MAEATTITDNLSQSSPIDKLLLRALAFVAAISPSPCATEVEELGGGGDDVESYNDCGAELSVAPGEGVMTGEGGEDVCS